MKGSHRSGFTLLEVILAMTLTAIVMIKVTGALRSANETTEADLDRTTLDMQARQVLRQIGFAIMGSHPDSLVPDVRRPHASSDMKFQVSLGLESGEVVWSEPEKIALEEVRRQVYWTDNPEALEERRVVWTSLVAPFLEGEIPNGIDDNGNGLIDEKGLSFTIDGGAVDMSLTLERVRDDGTVITSTVGTVVTCRNLVDGWRSAR
ncbi:MAG: type II secretion system protein [Planctomycetota bacterium]